MVFTGQKEGTKRVVQTDQKGGTMRVVQTDQKGGGGVGGGGNGSEGCEGRGLERQWGRPKRGYWEGFMDGSNREEKTDILTKGIDGIYLTHPSKTLVVALQTTLR